MFRILKSTSLLLLVFISRGYAAGVTNLHVKTNLEANAHSRDEKSICNLDNK